MIVLHTIGSHGPTYYNRYLPQFRKSTRSATPMKSRSVAKEQLVNTYDNTLVYVDYIVDKAINLLKEHQEKIADHQPGLSF